MDADGDGYGHETDTVEACTVLPGASVTNDDCNDQSVLVNPGGTEICNNIDDDCNSQIDDNALGTSAFYLDADGDGHGVSTDSIFFPSDL